MRKRILAVRDEELLDLLKDAYFFKGGVELLVADNGRQAFSLIEEKDPALVFLAPEMDELSGIDCCQMVKDDPILKSTPIVAILPSDQSELPAGCCRELFDEVISRPLGWEKLLPLTCKYLGFCEPPDVRVTVHFSARIRNGNSRRHQGQVHDLSIGGAFVETSHLVTVGSELQLEMDFPEGEGRLCCRARVSWVNHPEWLKKKDLPVGMGLQFRGLTEKEQEMLRKVLARG